MTEKHPSTLATTFTVAFTGKLNGLHPLEVAQQQFAQLFKTNPTQTAQLFSGKKVVLKTGLSKEQAEKYQKAIYQAGGECILEEIDPHVSPAPTDAQQPIGAQKKEASTAPPPPKTSITAPPKTSIAVPNLGPLTIAPVGATIGEPKKEVVRTFKNLDTITLAKAGEYIPTIPKPPAPPAPNISHLSLKN